MTKFNEFSHPVLVPITAHAIEGKKTPAKFDRKKSSADSIILTKLGFIFFSLFLYNTPLQAQTIDQSLANDENPAEEVLKNPNNSSPAEAEANFLKTFDYPELQVQPSASQRVLRWAQIEPGQKWITYWPIQLGAISLLVASHKAEGHYEFQDSQHVKELDTATMAGKVVGYTWLAGTLAVSAFRNPYRSGFNQIRFSAKDRKQKLIRERMAEEILQDEASLQRKLTWMSMITQAGASGYLLTKVHRDDRPFAVGGIVLALTPIIFELSGISLWERHETYKKRIYAPISKITPTLLRDRQLTADQFTMGLSYSYQF